VDPRAVLDAMVKRKIPSPRQESNPRTPIVHDEGEVVPIEKNEEQIQKRKN
jgi:hypothetical protein